MRNDIKKKGGVNVKNTIDMPLGLAFQMSMNEQAMENFAKMTEEEKKKVIEDAKHTKSKSEMQGIVAHLEKIR